MVSRESPGTLARRIAREIGRLPDRTVPTVRRLRRRVSKELRGAPGDFVLEVARALHEPDGELTHRWFALELIRYHEAALGLIRTRHLEEFSEGLDGWGAVDAFAGLLAGAAWVRGQVPDAVFHRWARSPDRWLRRAALASTVVLNSPSHGGHGDPVRTLAVCEVLVDDRDDMVVKALSWALRKLSERDPDAAREFVTEHDERLAARVRREVRNKLETGLKNPRSLSP
jgi:3-methyladenine DNA glycosylase AlkD